MEILLLEEHSEKKANHKKQKQKRSTPRLLRVVVECSSGLGERERGLSIFKKKKKRL